MWRDRHSGNAKRWPGYSCQPTSSKDWQPPREARRRQEEFSPAGFRSSVVLSTPWFWTSSLQIWESKFLLFWAIQFVVLCYNTPGESNPGLLTRSPNLSSSSCTLVGSTIKELHLSAQRLNMFSIIFLLLTIKTIFACAPRSTISPLPHRGTETGNPLDDFICQFPQ